MLIFTGDAKPDHDLVEERRIIEFRARGREVSPDVEHQLINTRRKIVASEQLLVAAAVAVGDARGDQIMISIHAEQIHFNAAAGAAISGIQYVGGQLPHDFIQSF